MLLILGCFGTIMAASFFDASRYNEFECGVQRLYYLKLKDLLCLSRSQILKPLSLTQLSTKRIFQH